MKELEASIAVCSICVLVAAAIAAVDGFYVENLDSAVAEFKAMKRNGGNEMIVVGKRYTEYQDNSLSYCTGICMYRAELAYGDCFDLCNWNGRSPSPWVRLVKHPGSRPQMNHFQAASRPTTLANRTGKMIMKTIGNNVKSNLASASRGRKSPRNGKLKTKSKAANKYGGSEDRDRIKSPEVAQYACKS